MSDTIIGTCDKCGGPVAVARRVEGMPPLHPMCMRCKAIPKNSFGPLIQMKEPFEKQKQDGGNAT